MTTNARQLWKTQPIPDEVLVVHTVRELFEAFYVLHGHYCSQGLVNRHASESSPSLIVLTPTNLPILISGKLLRLP